MGSTLGLWRLMGQWVAWNSLPHFILTASSRGQALWAGWADRRALLPTRLTPLLSFRERGGPGGLRVQLEGTFGFTVWSCCAECHTSALTGRTTAHRHHSEHLIPQTHVQATCRLIVSGKTTPRQHLSGVQGLAGSLELSVGRESTGEEQQQQQNEPKDPGLRSRPEVLGLQEGKSHVGSSPALHPLPEIPGVSQEPPHGPVIVGVCDTGASQARMPKRTTDPRALSPRATRTKSPHSPKGGGADLRP